MAEDKKISFGAQDSGLSSFMKKIMEDGKKMYSTFADEAKKQVTSSKEQNKFIQERIRLLKEELSVQKDIARQELNRSKKAYEKYYQWMQSWRIFLNDDIEEEKKEGDA